MNLTSRQRRAALLLAAGTAQTIASREVGVRRETLWRWAQLPAFIALVDSLQREVASDARRRLSSAAVKAVETLVGLLSADDDRIRLTAARDVLDRVGIASSRVAGNQADVRDQPSMAVALLEELRADRRTHGHGG